MKSCPTARTASKKTMYQLIPQKRHRILVTLPIWLRYDKEEKHQFLLSNLKESQFSVKLNRLLFFSYFSSPCVIGISQVFC